MATAPFTGESPGRLFILAGRWQGPLGALFERMQFVWDDMDMREQRVSSRDVVGAWLLACAMALALVLVSLAQPFVSSGSPSDGDGYTQVAGD